MKINNFRGEFINMSAWKKTAAATVQVHGDAWIARIFDNEDEFKRLEFRQSELSSSAPWIVLAKQQTLAKLRTESAETTIDRIKGDVKRAQQARQPVIHELTPAEAAKVRNTKWDISSASFLAEISVSSPRKLFIFII